MEEIQQLRDRLLQNLEEEKNYMHYFHKFDRIDLPHNKVYYMKELIEKYNLRHDFMRGKILRVPKKLDFCQNYIKQAQDLSVQPGQHVLTLSFLNRAFCCANRAAQILLPGAYALKGRIYQNRGDYKKALDVIRMALKHPDCPVQLQVDLTVIEMQCSAWLREGGSQSQRVEEDYTLSHNAHKDIPLLSCKLSPLASGVVEKRYKIFAVDYIKADEIIALDEPFCIHVTGNLRFYVCYNCTKEVVTPVPCPNCTIVVFCSEDCERVANQGYHGTECNVIDFLSVILDDFHYPALRLTLVFLDMFHPSIKKAIKFFKSRDSRKELFNLDLANFTPQDYYKAINSWPKNPDKDNVVDRMTIALIVEVITDVLFTHTPLKDSLSKKKDRDFFLDLFHYHMEIIPHNLEAVMRVIEVVNGRITDDIIGMGLYGLQKYFTYSSHPNVRKIFCGTKCVYISTKAISPGTVLSVEPLIYESHDDEKTAPVFNDLILDNVLDYCDFYEIPRRLALKDNMKLFFLDREFAITVMGCCSILLEEFEDFYPCYQLMTAEHCLWLAINIFLEGIPIEQQIDMPDF